MIQFEQVAVVVVSGVMAALAVFFLPADIAEASVIGYLSVLGGYLGISLAKTITESATLPRGEFADGNRWRYYLAMAIVGAIFSITMITGNDIGAAGPSLAAGFFVIAGALVSMIQGNKIATSRGTA